MIPDEASSIIVVGEIFHVVVVKSPHSHQHRPGRVLNMTTIANSLRHLRCSRQALPAQWQLASGFLPARPTCSLPFAIRCLNTESSPSSSSNSSSSSSSIGIGIGNMTEVEDVVPIPYQGITHARVVPATPSYFSRQPQFNDMYIKVMRLLAKYNYLPVVPGSEAPQMPWTKLDQMRAQVGEQIKASHYAQVMRIAKRLNLIEPSLRPAEVDIALREFVRDVNPLLNVARPITVDRFGRAVGVGKRKASTARAFVVEGTGEVLVNGKTLGEAFGRVHDRESAVWALTATERLDKYNVWALVEGGGTTGQAEALTLAVAKGLLAHEPALKPALRKAGCITRDERTVERKKHGHVKARKMPAWVKR